jgi:hypothetical protein
MRASPASPPRPPERRSSLERARRIVAACAALAALALGVGAVGTYATDGRLAVDYSVAFRGAAEAVWRGESPYTTDERLLDIGGAYVYPPPAAQLTLLTLPLSPQVARAVVTIVLGAALVGALLLLGVRDWRCHAVVLGWPATVSAFQTANVSIPLLLGAAVAWRLRATWAGPVALGLTYAVKPVLWPLVFWQAAAGRRLAAAAAIAVGLCTALVSWAAIGFDGLTDYPEILRTLNRLQEHESYSVFAVAKALGAPAPAARGLWIVVAFAFVALCVDAARRGREAVSFALAVGATLALSPAVWLHYLVALAVPLALARPRLGLLWFLPLVLWGASPTFTDDVKHAALVVAVMLVVAASPVLERRPGGTLVPWTSS